LNKINLEVLPDAFIIGEKFINNEPVALNLGDNFFFGQSLTRKLIECTKIKNGSKVFLHPVKNPSSFGVATINKKNKILKIKKSQKKQALILLLLVFIFLIIKL
jgi:glucose-1-phosphate thymidylyltransferase